MPEANATPNVKDGSGWDFCKRCEILAHVYCERPLFPSLLSNGLCPDCMLAMAMKKDACVRTFLAEMPGIERLRLKSVQKYILDHFGLMNVIYDWDWIADNWSLPFRNIERKAG